MKGFMRKRGESSELCVFLGNDPVTGKQRDATKTSRGGKREAQRQLAEMRGRRRHRRPDRTCDRRSGLTDEVRQPRLLT